MALITVEEAASHLRLDLETDSASPPIITDDRLSDLMMKIEHASGIIVDYLKRSDTGWDAGGAPFVVKAAVLLMLSALWEDREGTGPGDYLKPDGAIANLLMRFREPAYA